MAFRHVIGGVRIANDSGSMGYKDVMRGALEPCGANHVTGYSGEGCCTTGPDHLKEHTTCAAVAAEFLAHQGTVGNDLTTPMPHYGFPGLVLGDRRCVATVTTGSVFVATGRSPTLFWPQCTSTPSRFDVSMPLSRDRTR